MPELLDTILYLFPLDRYLEATVSLMAVVTGDIMKPAIWDIYLEIAAKYELRE